MCNVLLTAAGRDSQNVPSVVIQHFDASRGHSVDAYGFCRLLKNEDAGQIMVFRAPCTLHVKSILQHCMFVSVHGLLTVREV